MLCEPGCHVATSLLQLEQQQKDGLSTDQMTSSDLGTTHRCSVCASPRLNRGGADRRSRPYLSRHPPHQLHQLRYLHQYQPNHPPVFAQDDSLNHVATPYQKLGNGKNVDVRGALLLGYILDLPFYRHPPRAHAQWP